MKEDFERRLYEAVESVRQLLGPVSREMPPVGIVLGSGLGEFVDRIDGTIVPYSEIKGFPIPTVEGHRGLLKVGRQAAILAGRFHAYEGRSMDEIVLPVFLLAQLGITHLVVTNAAGAVNTAYHPGDLTLVKDHINLMGLNPLVGPHIEALGPRFPDMSEAYDRGLRSSIKEAWHKPLNEGVYAGLLGPTYETPSEIRMLREIGADMVGMSTVPEVIAARYLGLSVLGISCITNMAAGITSAGHTSAAGAAAHRRRSGHTSTPLSHEEVVETGRRVASEFADLLHCFLEAFHHDSGSP